MTNCLTHLHYHVCQHHAQWRLKCSCQTIYGKITPPIYHSIKSSHVRWPMSQVATCDQIGVTGARMWHCFCHILASVTPLWSQVATCDRGHCTCDNSILWCIGGVTEHMFFFRTILCREFIKKAPISDSSASLKSLPRYWSKILGYRDLIETQILK